MRINCPSLGISLNMSLPSEISHSSCIITALTPIGIFAPVKSLTASPSPISLLKSSPANISPIMSYFNKLLPQTLIPKPSIEDWSLLGEVSNAFTLLRRCKLYAFSVGISQLTGAGVVDMIVSSASFSSIITHILN